MAKIAAVKGTRDFYPEQMAVRNRIVGGWKAISIRNGFVEYDGPIFEHLQLFTQKSGEEIAEQLFSLTDRGGRDLAIRPEMTPTLARMVNQQINALPRPIKWYSVPRLCRAERPQRGRLREFFQWNIDIIGDDSVLSDAECIYTAVDYLRSVGLSPDDIVVKISSRAMLAAWLREIGFAQEELNTVYSLLDKRPKLPGETFEALAKEKVPDSQLRSKLMSLFTIESLDVLRDQAPPAVKAESDRLIELFSYLKRMGVADYCAFDINIVRGLAYYTGVVFEIFDKSSQLRALCGGGRYDNLLSDLGGPSVPATGFGMGDVVLEILLREKNLIDAEPVGVDCFVIDAGSNTFERAVELVSKLREKGIAAAFSYKRAAVGKQLKQASAARARFAVLVEELANQLTVKSLSDGSQQVTQQDMLLADPTSVLNG